MPNAIQFPGEAQSNAARQIIHQLEPAALRTFTPSQAVFAHSAGPFHFTPEGRKLYDYSSGVLVANLGHNPKRWTQRFGQYMGWQPEFFGGPLASDDEYLETTTLTAYNGITEVETKAVQRLAASLQKTPGGQRLDTIMWAASGSEAIQKALWAALGKDRTRDVILATRYGFHGKKGLSNAITGSEKDAERDPRVRFISFPMEEIADHTYDFDGLDLSRFANELEALKHQFGRRLSCLITEPYLGGGGSYHPPVAYHQVLQKFCRENDLLFLFDEVQANFGRTGKMYAFEKYQVEPDMVILGKGLGNGVPVAAVALNRAVASLMKFGEASDTWSANPLACAAVLATLDEFEGRDVLKHAETLTPMFFEGLDRLKETGLIKHVRGEGMVFGIECTAMGDYSAAEVAAEIVKECYQGEDGVGVHFLGALAGKVLRVSPPLTITHEQAQHSLDLVYSLLSRLADRLNAPVLANA